jgi:O-antigen ligase
MAGQFSEAVGKNDTMSHRTRIWEVVLSVPINPIVGTGYQSFWLDGPRVDWIWVQLTGDHVLSAHNGYIDTYLQLGLIGLSLLFTFLIASYLKIARQLEPLTPLGSLSVGLFSLSLFYNVTEAAFGAGFLFTTLLMVTVAVPKSTQARVPVPAPIGRSLRNRRVPQLKPRSVS